MRTLKGATVELATNQTYELGNKIKRTPSVLLVDDEEHIREAVALVLERRGYAVTPCADAVDALERLRAGAAPDLILLDLMMPGMDGWQFRVELKRNLSWSKIPVIALSADGSAKALAMDADSYLAKPVDHRTLLETIERVIALHANQQSKAEEHELKRLSTLGKLATEIVGNLEKPLSTSLENLQLAQTKAAELEQRLSGTEAFSMVGIRQLLGSAQRGLARIEALTHGTAAFAQLAGKRLRGRQRLLIVERDVAQLKRLRSWLENDYSVEAASSASDALRKLEVGKQFDAVLCELTPPSFAGIELYEALCKREPALAGRVIFMTQGAFNDQLRQFLSSTRRPQVRRPAGPAQLRQILDSQLQRVH